MQLCKCSFRIVNPAIIYVAKLMPFAMVRCPYVRNLRYLGYGIWRIRSYALLHGKTA